MISTLSANTLIGYYKTPVKHQWRHLISEVEKNSGQGDVIVIYPGHEHITAKYYITRDDLKIVPMFGKFPNLPELGDRRVWVIMHAHSDNRNAIYQGLSGKFIFEAQKSFLRLDLYKLKQN